VAYDLSGVKIVTQDLVRRVLIEEVDGDMVATGVELLDGRRFMARKRWWSVVGRFVRFKCSCCLGSGPLSSCKELK
jgi:hypothetical protein